MYNEGNYFSALALWERIRPHGRDGNMKRVYNFSAGPSMLPLEVLEEAQKDLLDYKGCGMSVMEMSHRTPEFEEIIAGAESSLRRVMNIPDNYKVLFLQGGASTQFASVPFIIDPPFCFLPHPYFSNIIV